MKILYLTFYFEPDLCAGSFRNTPIAKLLAQKLGSLGEVHVITTSPNRYKTYEVNAPAYEEQNNLKIHRIKLPKHSSGLFDQAMAFKSYYDGVKRLIKSEKYNLVVASSSRLFTAYLGAKVARKNKTKLYLDIRDLFRDTMAEMVKGVAWQFLNPFLKWVENYTFSNADHINLVSQGFKPYFSLWTYPEYSFHSNGIDDLFIQKENESVKKQRSIPGNLILYAGNIGEGQGLHKVIPGAAAGLPDFRFRIVGDGGARKKLQEAVQNAANVELINPVPRHELMKEYEQADYLFLHLNDFKAFEKVLPSKLFEYAIYDKPIVAGVSGYAREFVMAHIRNHILFDPGHVEELIRSLRNYEYQHIERKDFIERFTRSNISLKMVKEMLALL